MEILLTSAYAAFFVFLLGRIRFFTTSNIPLSYLKTGFLLKLFAGISLGLIYTYYYTDRLTADTFKFFDDSKVLYESFYTSKSDFFSMLTGINAKRPELDSYYNTMKNWYDIYSPFNDNRTMIRFNSLLRFISFGYYYVHVVFICFLSLAGIVAMVNVLRKEFPALTKEFYLIFILLPSVLFWGSGLLKDSLVFFSFGFTLYYFNRLVNQGSHRISTLLCFVLFLFLLMISKFQVFLLSIPLLTAWWLIIKKELIPSYTFVATTGIFLMILFLLGYFFPAFNLADLLARKQASFIELAKNSAAGSFIEIPPVEPAFTSILLNAPGGFMIALLHPNIADGGPALNLLAGLENTLILLFGFLALWKINIQLFRSKITFWFCLFYVIGSYTLIGTVTPVMGAIVRYKAQALPFLVIIFVIISTSNNESIFRKIYRLIRS